MMLPRLKLFGGLSQITTKATGTVLVNLLFNVYEDICKNQYLPELIIKNTFGFTPTKIGKWWDRKDREIDIVATDNSYNIIFGE